MNFFLWSSRQTVLILEVFQHGLLKWWLLADVSLLIQHYDALQVNKSFFNQTSETIFPLIFLLASEKCCVIISLKILNFDILEFFLQISVYVFLESVYLEQIGFFYDTKVKIKKDLSIWIILWFEKANEISHN